MSLCNAEEIKDISEIKNPYIKKAFECSINNIVGMTLKEFIKVVDYPIDPFMVDNFFVNLNDDIPIYVNKNLIEWCGFGSKTFDNKKMEFNRILEKFSINTDYWIYSNKEYEEYYEKLNSTNFPNPCEFRGKNKTKHIILTVDCFKQAIIMLNTPKAPSVRKHFIQMEKLVIIYMKYQCMCLKLNFQKELDEIKSFEHIKKYCKLQRINELENKLEQKYKIGVIYFICEEDNKNIVKIGYTHNLPNRLSSLQTAHYKKLIIKDYYFTQFPYEEEKRLHEVYKSSNIRGEWYRL